MFEVRSSSPMDASWLERDSAIREAAGPNSGYDYFSGTNFERRDHGWRVPTFEEAVLLKSRLETVPLVTATIREVAA